MCRFLLFLFIVLVRAPRTARHVAAISDSRLLGDPPSQLASRRGRVKTASGSPVRSVTSGSYSELSISIERRLWHHLLNRFKVRDDLKSLMEVSSEVQVCADELSLAAFRLMRSLSSSELLDVSAIGVRCSALVLTAGAGKRSVRIFARMALYAAAAAEIRRGGSKTMIVLRSIIDQIQTARINLKGTKLFEKKSSDHDWELFTITEEPPSPPSATPQIIIDIWSELVRLAPSMVSQFKNS